jgi:6-phosphogluconolactonase
MGIFDLKEFASAEKLAKAAAEDWLQEVRQTGSTNAVFCVALSGGRIARAFCSAIVTQIQTERLSNTQHIGDVRSWTPLNAVHFFWSDERCVQPTDPESNFRLAKELLFEPLKISESHIHRVLGEQPPEEAAGAADTELRQLVSIYQENQPVLDLVLLGMGEDGHVASLFPGESEKDVASRAVFRCVTAVKPPPLRITMGYAAIAAARQAWVLASGSGKEEALRASLNPNGDTPLARILRMRQSTRIYSDIHSDAGVVKKNG